MIAYQIVYQIAYQIAYQIVYQIAYQIVYTYEGWSHPWGAICSWGRDTA